MLGAPAGLTGKYYLSANTALDFGVGEYYRYRYHDAFHVFIDFLWHPVVLASTRPFELPLYIGVGARLLQHRRYKDEYGSDAHLGVRVPFGLLMDFNRVPFDIFVEFAFSFDFIVDHNRHDYEDFSGAIGARYYF